MQFYFFSHSPLFFSFFYSPVAAQSLENSLATNVKKNTLELILLCGPCAALCKCMWTNRRAKANSLWRGGKKKKKKPLTLRFRITNWVRTRHKLHNRSNAHTRKLTNAANQSPLTCLTCEVYMIASSLWAGKQLNYPLKPNTVCHINKYLEANFYKYTNSSLSVEKEHELCANRKRHFCSAKNNTWALYVEEKWTSYYFNLPQSIFIINRFYSSLKCFLSAHYGKYNSYCCMEPLVFLESRMCLRIRLYQSWVGHTQLWKAKRDFRKEEKNKRAISSFLSSVISTLNHWFENQTALERFE